MSAVSPRSPCYAAKLLVTLLRERVFRPSRRQSLPRWIAMLVCLGAAHVPLLLAQRGESVRLLRVSDNKRFLVTDDGRPFFWLGDTAWELFHRLTREEADHVPQQSRGAALHRHPGRRAGRVRRPRHAERVRPSAARSTTTPPRPTSRTGPTTTTGTTWTSSSLRHGRARALCRPAADLGRQVESAEGRGPGDLHTRERRGVRRLARPPLQGRDEHHLDRRRRPADRQRHAPGHHRRRWRAASARATGART